MIRIRGTITRIFLTKGFGFLLGDDGLSYFINADQVPPGEWESIRQDQRLEFTPRDDGRGGNGLRATDAKVCR